MSRRTHYIPVGNLVLDGVSIDPEIYCPANGYPDPTAPETLSQYCPAGGYVLPNDPNNPYEQVYPPYVPEEGTPEVIIPPSGDSITFIVNNAAGDTLSFTIGRNTGAYLYEIYGASDTLIDSGESASSSFSRDFSTMTGGYVGADGHQYFKVIIAPKTGYFTTLYPSSAANSYPLIEAYVNAPSLTIMSFEGCRRVKKIWCCSTMDSLNQSTTYEAFYNTISLEEITLPTSMALQNNLEEWFYGSSVPLVVLPANMPALTQLKSTFSGSKVKKVILPLTCPLVSDLNQTFYNTPFLKETIFSEDFGINPLGLSSTWYNSGIERITMPSSWSTNNINQTFYNCTNLLTNCGEDGVLKIYCAANMGALSGPYYNANKIRKVHYFGYPNLLTGLSQLTPTLESLEEVRLPDSLNGITAFNGNYTGHCPSLKKMIMPLSMSGLTSFSLLSSSTVNLEEITTCNDWGPNVLSIFSIGAIIPKVKRFLQPTLKVASLFLYGTSSVPWSLEEVEVDWSTITGNIYLHYNNLSASELNRIMNALPSTLTGKLLINDNPGSATCDITIAAAKGWDVTS